MVVVSSVPEEKIIRNLITIKKLNKVIKPKSWKKKNKKKSLVIFKSLNLKRKCTQEKVE